MNSHHFKKIISLHCGAFLIMCPLRGMSWSVPAENTFGAIIISAEGL